MKGSVSTKESRIQVKKKVLAQEEEEEKKTSLKFYAQLVGIYFLETSPDIPNGSQGGLVWLRRDGMKDLTSTPYPI